MRHGATFALVPLCLGIVLGPAMAGDWALPDESRWTRVAPLLLLSRPDVREDLGLSPEQAVDVEKAVDDLHRKAAALRGKTGEAAIAQRRLVDEGQQVWLEAHLTPEQVDRLTQLDLGWEGPAAMISRKPVAEALALSDEQKAALSRAAVDCNSRREKGLSPTEAERQHGVRAMSVLSDGQRQRWERMLGRPLSVKAVASAPRPTAR